MSIEININIISALMLLGGILGLLLSVLLMLLHKNNFAANRYLALFIFSLALMLLHQFLLDTGYIYQVQNMTGFVLPLEFVIPPALYLYIRTLTVARSSKLRTGWHFIPAVLGALLLIPFYMLDFATRLTIIKSNFAETEIPGLFRTTFPIFVTATGLQLIIYVFLYFKLLSSQRGNISQISPYRKNSTLLWLRSCLIFILGFWVFMMLFYHPGNSAMGERWLYLFGIVVIIYIGIMGLLQLGMYEDKSSADSELKGEE